jgi:hypothetical protein
MSTLFFAYFFFGHLEVLEFLEKTFNSIKNSKKHEKKYLKNFQIFFFKKQKLLWKFAISIICNTSLNGLDNYFEIFKLAITNLKFYKQQYGV